MFKLWMDSCFKTFFSNKSEVSLNCSVVVDLLKHLSSVQNLISLDAAVYFLFNFGLDVSMQRAEPQYIPVYFLWVSICLKGCR